MRPAFVCVLALTAVACGSDTGFSSDVLVHGEPNPKEVEPPIQTDAVNQVTTPEVDILFVVDNSCSMELNQRLLAENFPSFLEYFTGSGLDYHIGVVSTDMDNPLESGRLQTVGGERWIDDETIGAPAVFEQMTLLGIEGSGDEMGIGATYTALELLEGGHNKGFRREDAALHVVVVSDEDDQTDSDLISLSEFIRWMDSQTLSLDDTTFSSVVGPPEGCPEAWAPGLRYLDVTAAVGGVAWSICADDWSVLLEELGLQAAGMKREYVLSQLPVPGTIEVFVIDAETGSRYAFFETADWEYDQLRNSITFLEFVPGPLDSVEIRYEVLGMGTVVD